MLYDLCSKYRIPHKKLGKLTVAIGEKEIAEIEKLSIQKKLKRFKGTIIGNSAGAIVLSRGGQGDGKFYEGFGRSGRYMSDRKES